MELGLYYQVKICFSAPMFNANKGAGEQIVTRIIGPLKSSMKYSPRVEYIPSSRNPLDICGNTLTYKSTYDTVPLLSK